MENTAKLRVLVLDDKPEERAKALEIARSMNLDCVVCDPADYNHPWFEFMNDVDAIVTDLFWSPCANHPSCAGKELPPSGLLVVIHALAMGKPVVICTDADLVDKSWGHHGAAIGWIYDGYLAHFRCIGGGSTAPFEMIERKHWEKALDWVVQKAKQRIPETRSGDVTQT